MILSPQQIAGYAASAGFSGNDLAIAVAIALAESNPPGNTQSYYREPGAPGGTPTGKGSYGLWQIYLKAHPEFAGWNLYDPAVNAAAAFSVYSRQGFNGWSTYLTGAFRKYLNAAMQAVGISAAPPPAQLQPVAPDNSSFVLLPGYISTNDGSVPDTSNNVTLYAVGTIAAAGLLIALFW